MYTSFLTNNTHFKDSSFNGFKNNNKLYLEISNNKAKNPISKEKKELIFNDKTLPDFIEKLIPDFNKLSTSQERKKENQVINLGSTHHSTVQHQFTNAMLKTSNTTLSNSQVVQKNPLTISEESEKTWDLIRQTTENWKAIATKKKKETKLAFQADKLNKQLKNDFSLLHASYVICTGMEMEFALRNTACASIKWDKVLTCRDANNSIQAIAFYWEKNGKYKLEWLATNPENIKCAVNEKSSLGVRGAGTQIILHLLNKMIHSNGKSLNLEAGKSAIPFYKRMNFSSYDPKCKNDHEDTPMKLTKESVLELIQKKIEPFTKLTF